MPTWTEVRVRLQEAARQGGDGAFDSARREYLAQYEKAVGRPLVVYAADLLNPAKTTNSSGDIGIGVNDKDGWVEVTTNLPSGPLDLMLLSPGGSPVAAEWVVNYLRRRFDPVRVLVPHTAKSAATMIAMAADEIAMDDRGELGPIDPQISIGGGRLVPAQAILDQFEKARSELADKPSDIPVWIPILQQIGPSLITECQNWIGLSKELVATWLAQYMFRGDTDAAKKAKAISDWLGDHNNFRTHARIVSVDDLIQNGVRVLDLRRSGQEVLRDLVWTVWSAYKVTFDSTQAYKVFENSRGEAFIRNIQNIAVEAIQLPNKPAPTGLPMPTSSPPSRQQRRAQERKKR